MQSLREESQARDRLVERQKDEAEALQEEAQGIRNLLAERQAEAGRQAETYSAQILQLKASAERQVNDLEERIDEMQAQSASVINDLNSQLSELKKRFAPLSCVSSVS